MHRVSASVCWRRVRGICGALAAREGDRFAGVDTVMTPDGAVLVPGATVQLECEIQSIQPAGDHLLVLFRVVNLDVEPKREPLVYLAGSFRDLVTSR